MGEQAERGGAVLRLSDLLGALSYALDLTEGQSPGHCIRATWIGMHIGSAMALPKHHAWEVYYTVMLKDLGCSSNAARICNLYLSDDFAFKRGYKAVNGSLTQVLGFVLAHTAPDAGLVQRLRTTLQVLRQGGTIARTLIETRCQRGAEIAKRLHFPVAVCSGIHALDERWDGSGHPEGLKGEAIPLAARIALLSQVVDVFHRQGGREAAMREARARSGTWFDPAVVAAFERAAASDSFWAILGARSSVVERAVFDLDPAQDSMPIDEAYLDDIAGAFAEVIDAKSPFTLGHSERVAFYVDLIAQGLGYGADRRRWLRRAALLHDVGKLGVSNAILDYAGPLDAAQRDAVRQHARLSEEILGRVSAFHDVARIGGGHHERLDGKGYPRGLAGSEIDMDIRIVSAADVFDALTADRPYRSAMTIPDAFAIMEAEAGAAFDPVCLAALRIAIEGLDPGLTRNAA